MQYRTLVPYAVEAIQTKRYKKYKTATNQETKRLATHRPSLPPPHLMPPILPRAVTPPWSIYFQAEHSLGCSVWSAMEYGHMNLLHPHQSLNNR